jgi:hypothetical protein
MLWAQDKLFFYVIFKTNQSGGTTMMTDADKVFALTELMSDVIHTLEMKQYDIEDAQLSHDCVVDADKFHQQMIHILYPDS